MTSEGKGFLARFLKPRRALFWVLGALLALVLLGGAGGAALCKYSFDCGLRAEAPPENLQDVVTVDRSKSILPAGFREQVVSGGLSFPSDFDFLPDGRIIVAQRDGLFRLVENGRLLRRPVLDLRGRVDISAARGLVNVDVDPDFAKNGFFYTVYAQQLGKPTEPTTVRVSRFTMRSNVARADTEKVLLGVDGERPCLDQPTGADCLPCYGDHLGADFVFLDDGTMLISTGEGGGLNTVEDTALAAQSLDYLGGKILRVTRDGDGVHDNPFWNGSPGANRSKVWASGLRNPFRLAFRPGGDLYVGDVGWREREEISAVTRGANLGWPCFEGTRRTEGFRDTDLCDAFYRSPPEALHDPLLELEHPDSVSLTLGDFSTGLEFPKRFGNVLFFGDWGKGWLRYARIGRDGQLGPGRPFAKNTAGPVAIKAGGDGMLYYLALNAGELRRIRYG